MRKDILILGIILTSIYSINAMAAWPTKPAENIWTDPGHTTLASLRCGDCCKSDCWLPDGTYHDTVGQFTNSCGLSCPSGQYDIGFGSCIKASTDGSDQGYWNFDGDQTNVSTYGLTDSGQWGVTFDYGIVKGIASCNSTPGTPNVATDQEFSNTANGQYCWCKMTEPAASRWVFHDDDLADFICAANCADGCSYKLWKFLTRRYGMFGAITPPESAEPTCVSGKTYSMVNGACITTEVIITYDLNGGSGTNPTSTECTNGQACTLASIESKDFYKGGYKLLGWATRDSATSAEYIDSGTFKSDTKLYAVWDKCAINTYHPNSSGTVNADTCQVCSDGELSNESNTLCKAPSETFDFTTTNLSAGDTFEFRISAKGSYSINWGDGSLETIYKTDKNNTLYSHTYERAGTYTIKLGGKATSYVSSYLTYAAISFEGNTKLASIDGSLGSIFSKTEETDGTPSFNQTFRNCTNLKSSIPDNLFAGTNATGFIRTFGNSGVTGSIPAALFAGDDRSASFYQTFYGCSGLTGSIPENLFSNIKAEPDDSMFYETFWGCSGLTGSIPEKLFSGISGVPAMAMFYGTFWGCSGLTGSIPEDLFSGIRGAPAKIMFQSTFSRCSGLTGPIPRGLFRNITGEPAQGMFNGTFDGCSGLTDSIPENLFGNISGAPAERMFNSTFKGCSKLTGLIPENLFGNISGAPAELMFDSTFHGCSGLSGSIPEKLFGNISGAPAENMFSSTFWWCSGLTGSIPEKLFGNISGAPAENMFRSTFYGCSNLTGPIPAELFGGITEPSAEAKNYCNSMFWSSGLENANSCPENTTQVTTGFEPCFPKAVACRTN